MEITKEQKKIILSKYRAADGGATFTPNGFRRPHEKHLPSTVNHQNLPLFTVMLYKIFELNGIRDVRDINMLARTIKLTQVDQNKDIGLYYASPGWWTYHFSHDNQVAWVWACTQLGDYTRIGNMLNHGSASGWQFNPKDFDNKEYRLRSIRQPADVAWYKLCYGDVPGLFQWIHLCAKLIFTSFQLKNVSKGKKISEANLTYFRLDALHERFTDHEPKSKMHKWMYRLPLLIGEWWENRLLKYTDGRGMAVVWRGFWYQAPEVMELIDNIG